MSDPAYLFAFFLFVALALGVRLAKTIPARRRMITLLILYVATVHIVLAIARRDAWPFAVHGVFLEAGEQQRPLATVRFAAVDQSGREFRIDPKSWAPIDDRTLSIWWLVHSRQLDLAARNGAMGFLLQKAESARRSLAKGGSPPLLTSLAAPLWYSAEPSAPTSDLPYVRLRVYLVTRVPERKLGGEMETARLMAEFSR